MLRRPIPAPGALLVGELAKDGPGGIDRVGEDVGSNRLADDLLDRTVFGAGSLAKVLVLHLGQASLHHRNVTVS